MQSKALWLRPFGFSVLALSYLCALLALRFLACIYTQDLAMMGLGGLLRARRNGLTLDCNDSNETNEECDC